MDREHRFSLEQLPQEIEHQGFPDQTAFDWRELATSAACLAYQTHDFTA